MNRKVHMRDICLASNAGMYFPVCHANAKLLDCDKGRWETTGNLSEVTCQNCIKTFKKRYPWASGR